MSIKNILFVVCHPDDEAIWAGGLIAELSKFPDYNIYVCCLTGNDEKSERINEFARAQKVAKYYKGVIVGGPLRKASLPLPATGALLEDGLQKLGLEANKIDLLISHSPFGDEHMNPHHVQASKELYHWTRRHNVPYGYFSCLPLPHIHLKPLLFNMKRKGDFHIINFSACRISPGYWLARCLSYRAHLFPKFFFSALVDMNQKNQMLECYKSIDLELHRKAYAAFDNNCESLYLMDSRAIKPLMEAMDQMEIPGAQDLFFGLWRPGIGLKKKIEKVFFWRRNDARRS